jgi:hypothetical protein
MILYFFVGVLKAVLVGIAALGVAMLFLLLEKIILRCRRRHIQTRGQKIDL